MSIGSVSSFTASSILQNTVARLQAQLTTASTETSTGRLADIGLTLGSESGQDISMHQQMADLTAISGSNGLVTTQLATAANALTGLTSTAQSVLTQLVAGISGTPGSVGANAIQQTASSALDSFTNLMNSQAAGEYVFAGINTGVAPISSQTPTSAAQTAASAAFQTYLGGASASSITGAQMTSFLTDQSAGSFTSLFTGSAWASNWSSANSAAQTSRIGVNQTVTTSVTANQPGFQNMAQALTMVSAFGGLNLSPDAYTALMTQAQSVMNTSINGLIETSAAVGTMQNQVTQANSAITLQQDVLTTSVNGKETVNNYELATQVNNISTQLQTAYSLTAKLSKLSLVNYI